MTELLWAIGGTAVSMGVMYFACVRQIRRGHGDVVPDDAAQRELIGLRAELARLRRTTLAR